jgi:hypothetical protein
MTHSDVPRMPIFPLSKNVFLSTKINHEERIDHGEHREHRERPNQNHSPQKTMSRGTSPTIIPGFNREKRQPIAPTP